MTITTASAPAGRGEKNEQPTADLWRRLKSKTSRAAQRLKVGRSTGPQKGRDLCLFGDWLLEFFINGVRYAVDGRLIEAEILTESFGRERGLFDCFFFSRMHLLFAGGHVLLELRPLRSVGVRGKRVQVR